MAAVENGIRNEGEAALGNLVASCFADPLKFVQMMYPWGEPGTLLAYETGPDKWQTAALEVIGEMVAKQETVDKALRRALRLAVASGHGVGKALANDTPIPTPDGFIRIGSLAKGDKVFGPTGAPCTVMGVFPQGVTDAYRVTFSDGASVIACPDHQWTVKGRQERRKGAGWVTLTTRQLLEYGVSRPNGAARALMWEIPGQGAAQFKAQPVPIDPYTLGAWLGDGSHDCGRVTNADQEVWGSIEATYGLGKPWPAGKAVTRTVLGIKPELARLGVLRRKHVPDAYKINDAETRLAVLQGLLDTDGECGQHGSVTFSSTDQRLADDVIWLARSLGAVARLQPAVKKTGFRPCYRVTITAPKALRLFRIERKEARRHEPQERYLKRWVRSIEPVEPRETTCIAVSDQSRQFLCGDEFIVTHNTAFVAWIIQWFASTRPYPQIVVTANTKTQLQTKTWRELSKWHSVSLNRHWFEWTATQFKLVEKPDLWFATAVPWSVSNAQAFAGTHEEHVLMVFDEACFDDQTEVLTRDGWRLFKDLSGREPLLTMDPDSGLAEYRLPTKLFRAHRTGPMVAYRRRGADLMVTPNHRMWHQPYSPTHDGKPRWGAWRFTEAGKLSRATHRMSRWVDWGVQEQAEFEIPELVTGRKTWPARRVSFDLWMRFLGWFGSEGHLSLRDGAVVAIGISQKDEAVRQEIFDLCWLLGFDPKMYGTQVLMHSRQLGDWLLQYGKGALDKRAPECVRMAAPRQARLFLEAYARGDGYDKGSGRTIIYTSSERMAGDLQEIALKAGAISVVRPRAMAGREADFGTHKGVSSVDGFVVSVQWTRSALTYDARSVETVDYDGMVYCAEVPPHHLLLTRRNGHCLWSGNSNIEDIIWETAEGAMTTEGAMWVALGNPVKNTGRFRECWTRFRDRWITFQVDARKAKKANQNEIKQWIEDYGIESDFVKTRILGEFPSASPMQMIPVDLVDAAVEREVKWEHIPASTPKLMGVDVARGGSAQSVIMFRQGPKLLKDIFAYRIPDLMQLAAQVAKKINDYKPDVVFVDATGMGVGVYDRLVQLGFDNVVAVYTGDRKEVQEKKVYYNPRIEIWGRMKHWFRTADIPDHRALREDLIGPEYFFDQMQLMRLESKDDLQARGIPSPDFADALALTFSQAVPVKRVYGYDDEYSNEPEVV